MFKRIRPEAFQGSGRKKTYFEGWYLKHIDPGEDQVFSLIPGVSYAPGDDHAFIQFIDAKHHDTRYIRFPIESFSYEPERFDIRIGKNRFSTEGISVDITEPGFSFSCELSYSDVIRYPGSLFAPGIMGPFSYIPNMQCNHGVVSVDHRINGIYMMNGTAHQMDGGIGYIEKDWGTSFPDSWIWMQCNTFEGEEGTSFMLSYASIPWMGSSFKGFLCFLYRDAELHRFATYTGAKITGLEKLNDSRVLVCQDRKYSIRLRAEADAADRLVAPVRGTMSRDIYESITASIELEFSDKRAGSTVVLHGSSCGLELCDDGL